MEKITRNNYEVFFIDYFDGNLPANIVDELLLFLDQNPDLKEEFENFENISIETSTSDFPFKNELKKNFSDAINESNFDEFCIAYHENDLSKEEKSDLLQYAKENDLENQLNIFSKINLKASKDIFYEKDGLKKLYIDDGSLIDENSIEEFVIADQEGDLDLNQKVALNAFIKKNEKYSHLRDDYKKTVLVGENILFEGKASLKKFSLYQLSTRVAPYVAAASIVLVFAIFFSINTNDELNLSTITEIEKKPAVKKEVTNSSSNEKEEEKQTPEIQEEKVDIDNKKDVIKEKPEIKWENINPSIQGKSSFKFEIKYQMADIISQPKHVENVVVPFDSEFDYIIAQSNPKEEKFFTIEELIADRVKKDFIKSDSEKFSIWHIAEAGAKGLSKLTGKEYNIETGVDENGKVSLIAFNSENFEYSRKK